MQTIYKLTLFPRTKHKITLGYFSTLELVDSRMKNSIYADHALNMNRVQSELRNNFIIETDVFGIETIKVL